MNWNMVTGAKGAVKIKNRTYKDNTYNVVDRFYPSDPSYYTTKEMPAIVQQLSNQFKGVINRNKDLITNHNKVALHMVHFKR